MKIILLAFMLFALPIFAENPLDKIDYVDESSATQKADIQRYLKVLYSVESELRDKCPNGNIHSGSAAIYVVSSGPMCDEWKAAQADIEAFKEEARHKGTPWKWIDEVEEK